jgi:hypothetical protein
MEDPENPPRSFAEEHGFVHNNDALWVYLVTVYETED